MKNKRCLRCSICGFKTEFFLTKTLLKRYKVKFFRCTNCQFIEAEKPRFWLNEAYSITTVETDTGVLGRNVALSKVTALIFLLIRRNKARVLDFGGGYGIMTRMLRDIGLDCYWYDKYTENIFAKKFALNKKLKYKMITAFEVLEHLVNPVEEIGDIIHKFSPKIFLFSTTIHNGNPRDDWWYFSENGGQHISLYTKKTLKIMATKLNLNYSTNGRNIHVFSKFKIPSVFILVISILHPIGSVFFPLFYKSKTLSDYLEYKK